MENNRENMSKSTDTNAMHKQSAGADGTKNRDWWPNQLKLNVLRQHSSLSNPMGNNFNYAEAFKSLDLAAVKKDLHKLMTESQDWWPADFGIMDPCLSVWHGTVPVLTAQATVVVVQVAATTLCPLNSWPDNVNLDKARRLLWPVKQKYGKEIIMGRPNDTCR